ncbi:heavy metal-binding domain-containing protein [Vannielia litorea]|uniref:Uncharacterized conserved protein YbjQ, UPF0145 family n=1 Tax=Vannielia litorea TaxID=1217970 RepID=A0A1N6F3Q1_9RHOB|nr:heavy metal-binding domain-containing protein [Vannielia litorea]SIN89891.1 Uncharacterized conserved protein YbjQ, UPF0145 family [Vannielia litorea]
MIAATAPSVEGRSITACKGIETGEAILGGRSAACEQEWGKSRRTALAEMEERDAELGAQAVVGVDLDYEVIDNMLMASASGTAVTLG